MSILLLFEKSDSLSYNELKNATKISDDQFPRHVNSLLDAKLLTCSTNELTDESVIGLNMKYSNKRTKFRIAGTVQKETPQEVEQTHHAVEEDRKMYLQAAIVRIMKSRKVLKHNQLIQEVQNSFKFFWILVVWNAMFFYRFWANPKQDLLRRFQWSKSASRAWLTRLTLNERLILQTNIHTWHNNDDHKISFWI